jgi:transposase
MEFQFTRCWQQPKHCDYLYLNSSSPFLLLKTYIYGYPNRVQSSRRLEREASSATSS